MDIFENKNHRGLIYNGSKPVRVLQSPDEGLGNLYGHLDQGGWGNQNASNLHVRHVPDPMSNVFPGNPGPQTVRISQTDRPLYGRGAGEYEGPMKLTPGTSVDPKATGYVRQRAPGEKMD
jgi:hypothetical protein